jgi:hypothetical protein
LVKAGVVQVCGEDGDFEDCASGEHDAVEEGQGNVEFFGEVCWERFLELTNTDLGPLPLSFGIGLYYWEGLLLTGCTRMMTVGLFAETV